MNKKIGVIIGLTLFLCCSLPGAASRAEQNSGNQAEKISLDLKDIDISELFRILSLKTGKTIIPRKEVTGRITLYLNNVGFEDALDYILLSQGLTYEKKNNVYSVMPLESYKKIYGVYPSDPRKVRTIKLEFSKPANVFNVLSQLKSDLGKVIVDESSGTVILIDIPEKLAVMEKTINELDNPLETTVYDLNYAKPADAKIQLNAAVTPGTGSVIIDERNGKAIVSDLPKKMDKIDQIVKELDEETRQVFLSVDIIEVNLNNRLQRGIDWQKLFSDNRLHALTLAGHYPPIEALTTAYQKISIGTFASDDYSIVLNFLETYGSTKIISQPRIAAVNNEEARIMVGKRDAYVSQTLSQAESTTVTSENIEFIDVGVKLKVVPTINKDGFITMKIKPEVSSAPASEVITTQLGSRIPIVHTSEAETVVKVKEDTMVMIAGLIKDESIDTVNGLPFISRIPLLGAFFSNRDKQRNRTETIVFITPRLMRGDEVLKGAEPKKFIPEEVITKDLKEKFVREDMMGESLAELHKQFIFAQDTEVMAPPQAVKDQEQNNISVNLSADKKAGKLQKTSLPELDKMEKAMQLEENKLQAKPPEKPQTSLAVNTQEGKKQFKKQVLKKKTKKDYIADKVKEYYQAGLSQEASGDWEAAKASFEKALVLNKNYAPAYNQLGILYETKNFLAQAGQAYLKALKADPFYLPVYSNLALFNESINNLPKAIEYWRQRASLGDKSDPWTQKAISRLKELGGNPS